MSDETGHPERNRLVEKLKAIRDGREGDRNNVNLNSYQVQAAIALAYMEGRPEPSYELLAKIMEGTA